MDGADAPRAADGPGVDGPPVEGPFIGAAWNARENAVILTHDGECVALPLRTAIALRDALSIAIDIPYRAVALSTWGEILSDADPG
ncbi:hypothetical protein [Sphingopyxis terrae]|uniref:hypothetical protein n=1 Tax=Sphingopyxis terrae TaxID=33052 RepID=UPI003F80A8C6